MPEFLRYCCMNIDCLGGDNSFPIHLLAYANVEMAFYCQLFFSLSFPSTPNAKSLPRATESSNYTPVKNEPITCEASSNQKTIINSPLITRITSKGDNSTNSVETTFQRNLGKSLSKPDWNCSAAMLPRSVGICCIYVV